MNLNIEKKIKMSIRHYIKLENRINKKKRKKLRLMNKNLIKEKMIIYITIHLE